MKTIKLLFILSILTGVSLQSCIGDDYLSDRVDPVIRILNPLQSIAQDTTILLEAIFTNNIGLEEEVDFTWTSSNTEIATIDMNGNISAIEKGIATISVSVMYEDELVSDEFDVEVEETTVVVEEPSERIGELEASSFYLLEGGFTLTEQEDGNLLLQFDDSYDADTGLPGLYVYLTNNPNSVNGALEIAPVTTFSGAHEYIIEGADLMEFSHVLYFCKPFNVKVGDGNLSE